MKRAVRKKLLAYGLIFIAFAYLVLLFYSFYSYKDVRMSVFCGNGVIDAGYGEICDSGLEEFCKSDCSGYLKCAVDFNNIKSSYLWPRAGCTMPRYMNCRGFYDSLTYKKCDIDIRGICALSQNYATEVLWTEQQCADYCKATYPYFPKSKGKGEVGSSGFYSSCDCWDDTGCNIVCDKKDSEKSCGVGSGANAGWDNRIEYKLEDGTSLGFASCARINDETGTGFSQAPATSIVVPCDTDPTVFCPLGKMIASADACPCKKGEIAEDKKIRLIDSTQYKTDITAGTDVLIRNVLGMKEDLNYDKFDKCEVPEEFRKVCDPKKCKIIREGQDVFTISHQPTPLVEDASCTGSITGTLSVTSGAVSILNGEEGVFKELIKNTLKSVQLEVDDNAKLACAAGCAKKIYAKIEGVSRPKYGVSFWGPTAKVDATCKYTISCVKDAAKWQAEIYWSIKKVCGGAAIA